MVAFLSGLLLGKLAADFLRRNFHFFHVLGRGRKHLICYSHPERGFIY